MRRLRQIGRTRKAFSTGAGGSRPRRFLSQKPFLAEQVNQRQSADSCPGFEQKVSSRNKSAVAHFAIIQSSHDFSPIPTVFCRSPPPELARHAIQHVIKPIAVALHDQLPRSAIFEIESSFTAEAPQNAEATQRE